MTRMAFSDNRTQTGACHSLDGVNFKIGDTFLPPRKVTMPLNFQTGSPEEVLFTEYDFSLEESVLEWAEAQRESQQAYDMAETERVGATIEDFAQCVGEVDIIEDLDHVPPDTVAGDPHAAEVSSFPAANQPTPNIADPVRAPQPMAAMFGGLGSDILKPIQLAKTVPNSTATKDSSDNHNTGFNVKDFENEADPFDNLELETINDMEELNKVLLGAQASSVSQGMATQRVGSQDVSVAQSGYPCVTTHSAPSAMPQPAAAVSAPKSLKDVDYPDFMDYTESSVSVQPSSNSVAFTPCSAGPGPNQESVGYHRGTDTVTLIQNLPAVKTENHFVRSGALPPIPSSKFLVQQNIPTTQTQCAQPSANMTSSNVYSLSQSNKLGIYNAKILSSGSPYSRHSSELNFNVPNGFVEQQKQSRSQGSTPPPGLPTLRSTKSTPDITKLDDSAKSVTSLCRTPSPGPRSESPCSPAEKMQKRQSWNPYVPLPPSPQPGQMRSSSSGGSAVSSSSDGTSPQVSLPDPYQTMSSQEKEFINNIGVMGFPRNRVARAVQKLGQDDKKVVDHLILVNKLIDLGHDGNAAETALFLFEEKEEKANQYLKLTCQFKELGFQDDKIKEALVKYDNDEEQALDFLTAT